MELFPYETACVYCYILLLLLPSSQQAGSQARFSGRGSQPQVPRNSCPYKFPKNRFTSKVAGKSSQALFPGLSQPWGKILVFVPKCLHVKGNVCLSAQTPPIHWSVNFQGKEIRTKCASRLKASSTGNPWTCGLCTS